MLSLSIILYNLYNLDSLGKSPQSLILISITGALKILMFLESESVIIFVKLVEFVVHVRELSSWIFVAHLLMSHSTSNYVSDSIYLLIKFLCIHKLIFVFV